MNKKTKISLIIAGLIGVTSSGYLLANAYKSEKEVKVASVVHSDHIIPKKEVKEVPVTDHQNHNLVTEKKEVPVNISEVGLSPSQQVMANVAIDTVKTKVLTKEINTVGKISYDETRLSHISSWIPGRIEKIYTNFTGLQVNKGDKMLEIYSPELVSAQQEYIQAYESYQRLKGSTLKEISDSAASLLEASRQRLLLLGVKESQLAEIKKTRRPILRVPVYATASGIIVAKNVQEGHYVETGASLFDITDLSKVWMVADVYEYEMASLKNNQEIEITTDAYPDETFSGKITFISPSLEAATKTVKVRAEFPNYNFKLKPEMVVNAKITASLPGTLVVPRTAVLLTGKKPVVWKETMKGMFKPVEVKIGQADDEFYPVISGLKKGDRIAVSGGFLLDSESQINTGADPHAGMNMEKDKATEPEKKGGMENMPGM